MKMSDDFTYVNKIPKIWEKSHIIEREGIRHYVQRGDGFYFRQWYTELAETFEGDLIPLQWVPQYIGISRAAVHKRVKREELTIFTYIVTEETKNILGGRKVRDTKKRYDFAVLSECEEWRNRLIDRAARHVDLTNEGIAHLEDDE